MSNALAHPMVTAYLASVEAEAAVLSDDRRRDLVADLREHIESVLPQGFDDAAVRQALDRLGSPREIAAAAIAEEPGVQPLRPESSVRTAVTLGMMVLAAPFWVVGVGLVLAVVAAVRIWRSPSWTDRDRRMGVAGALSPLLVTPAAAVLLGSSGRLGAAEVLGAFLIAAVIPLAVAVHLGRGAARLRPQAA
ncbi:HAAS signaling domain-containing protein [Streptomyces sp. enrichment culture]|uniref:HAAS signaling domain-containing protein n=1 Tax=Streptomyces sp. enrichment culture TaxID=1795815 RepID=UPI003F5746EB